MARRRFEIADRIPRSPHRIPKTMFFFSKSTHSALWRTCVSKMAGSLSSSMEGTGFSDSDMSADESTSSVAHREKNLMSLLKQENRVLKMELETCKLRCKQLQEENRALRQASVSIVSSVFCYFKSHLILLSRLYVVRIFAVAMFAFEHAAVFVFQM